MYGDVLGVGMGLTVDKPMAFLSLRSGECEGVFFVCGPGGTWNRKDLGTIIIILLFAYAPWRCGEVSSARLPIGKGIYR